MNKYQQGKIYKIVCNETGDIYIGSTIEPTLARRLAKHVAKYKFWLKTQNYKLCYFI
jgi:predicted GIY-YIG superfamily endonuclease